MSHSNGGPRPVIRDQVLRAAKSLGRFTRTDLVEQTGLNVSTLSSSLHQLMEDGEIARDGKRDGAIVMVYRDIQKINHTGESAEDALWTAMRTLRRFDPTDLLASLAACNPDLTRQQARSYCQTLLRAKYLRCVVKAVPGKRDARYVLAIDSGPKAPVMRRLSVLVDPNEERVAWVPEVMA